MKRFKVFYNGQIYTQAGDGLIADSMVISGKNIMAVGNNLERDADFNSGIKIDLKGKTVLPGFTDSHTHFIFMADSIDNVKLDNLDSLEETLNKIKRYSSRLGRKEWIVGEGFSPDRWGKYIFPDKVMLDNVTGGRPAAIFSKDQHMMWVNSRALNLAGINRNSSEPIGGKIERLANGEPSGILKEIPGYFPVVKIMYESENPKREKSYKKVVRQAYSKGITGVHSFDGPNAFSFFKKQSDDGTIGLRVNYYPPPSIMPVLKRENIGYGYGNEYFRLSGIKLFADGSLGSQSAYCFNRYIGSDNNFGIEATSPKEMVSIIKKAAANNMPCAIHAIGDKAVANVLDCFEKTPRLKNDRYHRIEHLQMIRRVDIRRLKKLNVVASMQPSHCPSDIGLMKKYWGYRGRNCFIFNTILNNKIPLVFGSDAPIEPLDPLAGIGAAVNRTAPGGRKVFYPEERIIVAQAVASFTTTPARIVGRGLELGCLLPGFKADFIMLSENIYKTARTKLSQAHILATFFDGQLVYKDRGFHI